MKGLLNPKLIFAVQTLPLCIYLYLGWAQFKVIESSFVNSWTSPYDLYGWYGMGIGGVAILVGFVIYTGYLIQKEKNLSFGSGLALLSYPMLYLLYYNSVFMEAVYYLDVDGWAMMNGFETFPILFNMPAMLLGGFVMVIQKEGWTESWKTFRRTALAIFVVLFCLFLWNILYSGRFSFIRITNGFFPLMLFVSFLTTTLLYFAVHWLYKGWLKRAEVGKSGTSTLAKVVITLLLPLLGLTINSDGFVGNLSDPWFFILAMINGLLISLPPAENTKTRMAFFIGKCILFSYSTYLLIVVLPFIPISVFLIVLFGAGLLLLAPIGLFVIHGLDLFADYEALSKQIPTEILKTTVIVGLGVLPFMITVSNIQDRMVLDEALEYVYTPNYIKDYDIDKTSLANTLKRIRQNKSSRRNFYFGQKSIPYLSNYFNWIALDNLTLSDHKIGQLEKIFWGETRFNARIEAHRDREVELTKLDVRSTYDVEQEAWLSWVDFELTNRGEVSAEYLTNIELPAGVWISDYYLDVFGERKPGILSEKKAAMWVFSQIRNFRRDPGLLFYRTGNKVQFRVFPFGNNELRQTGIQFIHKEPFVLTFDGQEIALGDPKINPMIENPVIATEQAIYISGRGKNLLKKTQRTPYYHFVVDASVSAGVSGTAMTQRIEQFLANQPLDSRHQISLVGSDVKTISMNENWRSALSMRITS